jgi:hypothetical protein
MIGAIRTEFVPRVEELQTPVHRVALNVLFIALDCLLLLAERLLEAEENVGVADAVTTSVR